MQKLLNEDMPFPVPIQGSWVFPLKVRLFLKGTYEAEVTNLIKRAVKKDWVVADVGTQHGYYTLLFARLVGKQGHVYAFAPDPVSYRRLMNNVQRNHYKNVVAVPKAATDRIGVAKFYVTTLGYGKDTMFPKPNYPHAPHEFPTTTLDNEIPGIPHFMKVDVEGAELLVLEGAKRILQSPDIGIVLEFHPRILARTKNVPADMLETLHSMGFLTFTIKTDGTLTTKTDTEITEEANARDGINLFACKKESLALGGRFAGLLP